MRKGAPWEPRDWPLEKTEVRDDSPLPPELALWDLPQYVDESGSMAKLPLRSTAGTKRTCKAALMHVRLAGNNGHDANVMRCPLLAPDEHLRPFLNA